MTPTRPSATPSATLVPTTPAPSATATPSPSATPTPIPPTASATATPTITPSPTPLPGDLWLTPSDLRVHPDGDLLYSGDLVSFQVSAHHGYEWTSSDPPDVDVEIWRGAPGVGTLVAEGVVSFYGERDGSAWLQWVWDTSGVEGEQALTVLLDPDDEIQIGDENVSNNLITSTIELLPVSELPEVWAEARWVQQTSACCVFHYISGSAANRDIDELTVLVEDAVAYAAGQVQADAEQAKMVVYLIDRVLGHGGFATDALIISYLDRFYPGGDWAQVFRHEATHIFDQQFAEVRPSLLAEGLAVYVAGGHFREEPIEERAAALLALGRYVPLSELADAFYPTQHEIGYLEAAGFASFLIDRYGWDDFEKFYGDIPGDAGSQSAMIDAALQAHFDLTLAQAEADWLTGLRARPAATNQVTDLRLTIEFYDTVRRYQLAWDPSAHFQSAWLPSLEEAERRQITADFVRHPTRPLNLTLETMFIAADQALDQGEHPRADELLDAINAVLDADGDLNASSLADQYGTLVLTTAAAGYQAQTIDLDLENDVALVLAAKGYGADTVEMVLARDAGVWRVTSWGN